MDSNCINPLAMLMDSSIGATIYNKEYELIAWNSEYAELGITPKADLREGFNLLDTYSIAVKLGVFNSDDSAEEKFRQAVCKDSPSSEVLNLPTGGRATVRRIFLPGLGVAALFVNSKDVNRKKWTDHLSRVKNDNALDGFQVLHSYNNRLTKILARIELATITGDDQHLEIAKNLCTEKVDLQQKCKTSADR